MDLAENRRAASAATTITINDAACHGRLAFKNNATFNCALKINAVLIGNTEVSDVVIQCTICLNY